MSLGRRQSIYWQVESPISLGEWDSRKPAFGACDIARLPHKSLVLTTEF